MKFSCLKNDLKNALKPIDKFSGIFKQEPLMLKIYVGEKVLMKAEKDDYGTEVILANTEIQETGAVEVSYEDIQKILKAIRRNILLSFRLVQKPEGLDLIIVTPEGEMHRIPAQVISSEVIAQEGQPVMNLAMDEFWQALIQVNRVVPKKHLIEMFTKVKWVVSTADVRWVAVNQTELAIKHFQSLVSEGSHVFYVKGTDMDILKKCVSAISDQRLLVEVTESFLKVSGESATIKIPIEQNENIPVEQLIVRDMVKCEVSIPTWMEQINKQLESDSSKTSKQLKYRPELKGDKLELCLIAEDEQSDYGFFPADEFLKIFKNDAEGSWQCWIPTQNEPMIAFVKSESNTTFYLYLLTTGLM